MSVLYPLKFAPKYLEKIWGGQHIKTILHQDYGDMLNCGEAWLLSGFEGQNSIVSNGDFAGDEINELIETFMGDLVGDEVFNRFGERFPLLIKVIDPLDSLSVQVHPDDELANQLGMENGKTEMWYVMNAEEGSEIVTGFNKDVSLDEFENALKTKTVESLLNYEKAEKGDVFFIPARRIHALGAGCMVAEIQQTSDTSYRVYDYDRIDRFGMKRELHVDEAVATLNFKKEKDYKTNYDKNIKNATVGLVSCPYFTTNLIKLDARLKKDYSELDSFVVLMCVSGCFSLLSDTTSDKVNAGECILIPNVINKVDIVAEGNCEILEVYIV